MLQLGSNIRKLRKLAGLSQPQLAARLGVTQGAISIWESGGGMTDENKVAVAREFGITLDALMLGEIATEPAQSVHSACTAPE